jgi:hypothetical protein
MNLVAKRFPIRFGRFNAALMGAFGMGRRNSYVEVSDSEVKVRMGLYFSATIPRSSIKEVGEHGYVWWAYGVHWWGKGRFIVNGSGHRMVTIRIDPAVRARATGVPVTLRELWVSVEDPDGLRAAIGR